MFVVDGLAGFSSIGPTLVNGVFVDLAPVLASVSYRTGLIETEAVFPPTNRLMNPFDYNHLHLVSHSEILLHCWRKSGHGAMTEDSETHCANFVLIFGILGSEDYCDALPVTIDPALATIYHRISTNPPFRQYPTLDQLSKCAALREDTPERLGA